MKFPAHRFSGFLGVSLCSTVFLWPAQAQAQKNVLASGSFEALDKNGHPTGWAGFSPNAKVVKETKAGGVNHYVVVAPNSPRYTPFISYRLPLKPQWKNLRISARMKATKVKMGKQGWQGPRLNLDFHDATGKSLFQTGGPRLNKDSGWKVISQDLGVPKNAKTLIIQVAVFGPSGQFSVDDIKVVAK